MARRLRGDDASEAGADWDENYKPTVSVWSDDDGSPIDVGGSVYELDDNGDLKKSTVLDVGEKSNPRTRTAEQFALVRDDATGEERIVLLARSRGGNMEGDLVAAETVDRLSDIPAGRDSNLGELAAKVMIERKRRGADSAYGQNAMRYLNEILQAQRDQRLDEDWLDGKGASTKAGDRIEQVARDGEIERELEVEALFRDGSGRQKALVRRVNPETGEADGPLSSITVNERRHRKKGDAPGGDADATQRGGRRHFRRTSHQGDAGATPRAPCQGRRERPGSGRARG